MSYPISDEASVARRKAWEEQVKGMDPAPTQQFGFETALINLKSGRRVCRAGWNGKGMWLTIVRPKGLLELEPEYYTTADGRDGMLYRLSYAPHIAMRAAPGDMVPWLASVTDLMAEDWMVVP